MNSGDKKQIQALQDCVEGSSHQSDDGLGSANFLASGSKPSNAALQVNSGAEPFEEQNAYREIDFDLGERNMASSKKPSTEQAEDRITPHS